MCGIYGELALGSGVPVGLQGEAATDRLRHRGPDDRGTWSSDKIFLGMRRLSIIDLVGGSQPIWNHQRTVCIVYNGELYNFWDLRRELETKGHRFGTRSDTEVVLQAYEAWVPIACNGSTACSRSRSGMGGTARCCWRVIGWVRSRSTTTPTGGGWFSPRRSRRCSRIPRSRVPSVSMGWPTTSP